MTITPIDCRSAMRELWDYLDNELPAARTEQIRSHLATCTGCEAHMQFCRSFLQQIDVARVAAEDVTALRERVQMALQRDGLSAVHLATDAT